MLALWRFAGAAPAQARALQRDLLLASHVVIADRPRIHALVCTVVLWAGAQVQAQAQDREGMGDRAEDVTSSAPIKGATRHGSVHIPEPMIFDLVRGLGAKEGEFEVNVLSQFPINHSDSRRVEWAPEIEYAILNGVALELELPFEDGTLEAYKAAAQFTFGQSETGRFIHGTQTIVEKIRGKDQVKASLLYIPAFRFNERWSALGMIGARDEFGSDAERGLTLLLNASVFMEVDERTTLGIETNYSNPEGHKRELLLMPQVHYKLTKRWSVQGGLGAEFEEEKTNGTAALRMILTF